MKTYFNCVPCFFKQAIESSRLTAASPRVKKKIINEVAKALVKFPLSKTPPEMGRDVFKLVRELSGNPDPYDKIKRESNAFVLKIYPGLKNKIARSKDRLLTALELAIAGNIIDYGLKKNVNVKKEIDAILLQENRALKKQDKRLFEFSDFKASLKKAKSVVFIGDNAGEIVFDRLLIEEILRMYPQKEITYAVKAKPVINDALMKDAYFCGINKLARVVSSGCDAPGTILSLCSKEFLKEFKKADLVISKGMGNYEALSESKGPIYFLFMAKCEVVAKHVNSNLKDVILLKNRKIA